MMRIALKLVVSIVCLLCVPFASGVGTGGTGLYMRGTLALAPGVVVNNVTFDASQAAITINGHTGRPPSELRPGMVAGVNGNVAPGQQYGVANQIGVTRSVTGISVRVGTGGTGLKVGGIYVTPRTDTVYAGIHSIGDVVSGDTLDVYGYSDGVSGNVYATRIERVAPGSSVELHGIVMSPSQGRFVLQGLTVDASNAQLVGFTGSIAAGDRVGVAGTFDAQSVLVATTVTLEPDTSTANGQEAEIEDAVTAVLAPGLFVVNDFVVDATNASFSGGSVADLAVGHVVHVEGRMVNGTLVAKTVEFDDDSEDGGYSGSGSTSGGTSGSSEVDGTIASVASSTSFVVKSMTIDASSATFNNGQAADVAVGRLVKVIGIKNGSILKASKVTFVNTSSGGSGEVEGKVSAVTAAGVYTVGGTSVDARTAKISGGSLATIKVGTKIEASGAWQSGVLVAKKVSIDD